MLKFITDIGLVTVIRYCRPRKTFITIDLVANQSTRWTTKMGAKRMLTTCLVSCATLRVFLPDEALKPHDLFSHDRRMQSLLKCKNSQRNLSNRMNSRINPDFVRSLEL